MKHEFVLLSFSRTVVGMNVIESCAIGSFDLNPIMNGLFDLPFHAFSHIFNSYYLKSDLNIGVWYALKNGHNIVSCVAFYMTQGGTVELMIKLSHSIKCLGKKTFDKKVRVEYLLWKKMHSIFSLEALKHEIELDWQVMMWKKKVYAKTT